MDGLPVEAAHDAGQDAHRVWIALHAGNGPVEKADLSVGRLLAAEAAP